MTEAEGVIKFDLRFRKSSLADNEALSELLKWRDAFYRLGAIGQDPERYLGYAFGNISCRLDEGDSFIISGTQTGQYATAHKEHFTCVDRVDLDRNRVSAHGPIEPSSESLTHAAIYALNPEIRCVVHGHLPQLWKRAQQMGIPATPAEVDYGTPQMARAMTDLYREQRQPAQALFAMLGHEDGVIGFAENFRAIEKLFLEQLAQVGD